jgi:hypothetical protein
MSSYLYEGGEKGDLARLVQPTISIDEYRSKMGEDKDVVVLGVVVFGQEPAEDLVSFIEKSYDFVLDSDVSSGETSDGNYMVFVELKRDKNVSGQIIQMFTDIMKLTDQSLKDWTFTYYKDSERYELTREELSRHIIATPVEYEIKSNEGLEESIQLNHLRSISGIKVQPQAIKDVQIINWQIAAGIK